MSRAAPLSTDDRRAALIAATEPLVESHGRGVTTRQIAEAAGVAEGTIFRAFPTKDALIDAVLDDIFDVQHTCDELIEIPIDEDLAVRVTEAVRIVQSRLRRVFAVFHSLRIRPQQPDAATFRERQHDDNRRLNEALAAVLIPDRRRLRMEPVAAADALRAMTFALSHPLFSDTYFSTPEQIVDLLLYGILDDPEAERPTTC